MLLVEWDGRTRRTRWEGGGMEGLAVAGAGSVAPPFSFEVRGAAGSGSCHHFHQCCKRRRVFVPKQQTNHNTLHINPNCNIVQDSKNSTRDTILIRNTTKCTKNENVPGKNCQKKSDIKIEYSHPYIAELVQNMPKYRIYGNKYRPLSVGGSDSFYVNI